MAQKPTFHHRHRLPPERPAARVDLSRRPSGDINILLLGPTGIGKTTFINALANYITYDSLAQAVASGMIVLIPSSFTFFSPQKFENETITIGAETKYERFSLDGQSATQECRSFIFRLGNRQLRIIDTPGIGDTRGLAQDAKNLQEIFTTISQYQHLNAICILLKPNEQRLTVPFEYCINELLRHLPTSAKDNLMFVFTHSRETFYNPGNTKKLMEVLLEEHRQQQKLEIPFSLDNTFLFDNEPFRYLAIRMHGIQLDDDHTTSYQKSWNQSVKECSRFLTHVVRCPLHSVQHTISLNEAEQLIRKLPRPIAETQRLIEENIQLAQDYKQRVLDNPEVIAEGIPQNTGRVHQLQYPRTVCAADKCRQIVNVNNEQQVRYTSICHDECYLKGVTQETLADPNLENCTAMDYETGFCRHCGCSWTHHIHITYEYVLDPTRVVFATDYNASTTQPNLTLADIDKRITDLRRETAEIQDVYKQLAEFLHANAMLSFNDSFGDYLQYFIEEETGKKAAGANNADVIKKLKTMKEEFENHMQQFKSTLQEMANADKRKQSSLKPENVFHLVETLYDLPINGRQIREQVKGIKTGQHQAINTKEHHVNLPAQADRARVMRDLIAIVAQ